MYRITFSPNGLEPFIWKGLQGISTYQKAVERFNLLADFDLGRANQDRIVAEHGDAMINAYKAYRRKHGINHSSMIQFSDGSIDQFDESTQSWWVVSETIDNEPEYEIGEVAAFDNMVA